MGLDRHQTKISEAFRNREKARVTESLATDDRCRLLLLGYSQIAVSNVEQIDEVFTTSTTSDGRWWTQWQTLSCVTV